MKVLFHIDELVKWPLLESNLKNILKEDPSLEIIVVINGEAVKIVSDTTIKLNANVLYQVCHNSLNAHHLTLQASSLFKIIPSGVYQIALLQEKGYSYIKP